MFGSFKRRVREEPVEIDFTCDVQASAEDFYRLVDFDNPDNAKAQLGHRIVAAGPDRFELTMSFLPDHVFPITIESNKPGRLYTIKSFLPDDIGCLEWTRETYEIEPTGAKSCRVRSLTIGNFVGAMTDAEYEREVATLALGCENAFAKLKVHAEGGLEEVRNFEAKQAA